MAATFGASTRATFAAIVFVFELTRDYNAILPLMGATVLASLVVRRLSQDSLLTEKLTRRGLVVPSDYHIDVLRSARLRDVMTSPAISLRADDTVADAAAEFARTGHGGYPVVDDAGRCVAVLTRGDLLRGDLDEEALLGSVLPGDVVTATPEASVATAFELMHDEGIEHLPVVDHGGRLVGVATRADVLAVRVRHLAADRVQPGWLARPRAT
jgi:CBS domain-containing protein